MLRLILLNLFVLIIFSFDRFLKLWFLKNPSVKIGSDFISGLFNFHLETNTGMAFGLILPRIFLTIAVFLIIFFLFFVLVKSYQQKKVFNTFFITLIIAGAVSNLIDRLRFGLVLDYIDVPWFTVFNLADVMISFGVALWCLYLLVDPPKFFKGD
ncbi:MAG: signal peptidase II [Candidatus Buchananbacteria bacterium RIFCSPHIGHO2_01_FULL_39_14]|uniref:Lipoprotein signal peptidase n=2 Tax=Candidatus Buchananiibacteriota TaxID=1817903 RepID=A0A1G1YMC5_9BACT|nr:MAG: signal peptidase II [Candidatus Buchananbacteria bacterium RIFCSPHIGHO2_01_FULL_39_14]OGY48726.1 MAG: signal peptidase II [Candidatus Buchananbacteria bacterium RIFCSPHIGHO2_02_FULL_39_17]OGY53498.1 MAG: signal peptidase II [Candidatus Buchananbacteria bacterium RIFCSPLOWO2_01_FULL_40_23b]